MVNISFLFQTALPSRGFLIRIQLFGYMELDLPTPLSLPPSLGMRLHTAQHNHPQKYICKYKNSKFTFSTREFAKFSEKKLSGKFTSMENALDYSSVNKFSNFTSVYKTFLQALGFLYMYVFTKRVLVV